MQKAASTKPPRALYGLGGLETARPGTVVEAPLLPFWLRRTADEPTVFGGAILDDYSVQAWAELVLPDTPVTVRAAGGNEGPVSRDRVLLWVPGKLPDY